MTDEQVDRIVRALEGSGELWSALGVALVAALFGALLTLGLQWVADRKRVSESEAAARAAAAKAAAVLAAQFAMTPGGMHTDLVRRMPELAAPTRTDLLILEGSGQVAKWWTRQLLILAQPPAEKSGLFNRDEMSHKAMVAMGVQRRMLGWATGMVEVSQFHEANDVAFLEALEESQK